MDPYLDLLKSMLIDQRSIDRYEYHPLADVRPTSRTWPLHVLDAVLRRRNFTICKRKRVDAYRRMNGYDHPANALTMIGRGRLEHLEACVEELIANGVQGDLLEAGVWRGGAAIYLRALLRHHACSDRSVWVADSFQGLPPPDLERYPADKGSTLHREKFLQVSEAEVRRNFSDLGLLDDQVRFLPGWFEETLPTAPIGSLALLRVDCDTYASTTHVLQFLYPKVSPGGIIIIDDHHAFPACKKAVEEFRQQQAITSPLIDIDLEAVYWRKHA